MGKYTKKKKCSCGRFIIISVEDLKKNPKKYTQPFCMTCKTYGLEKSKQFLKELKSWA